MKRYYEQRAPEYDATTYELARDDEEMGRDLARLEEVLAGLPPGRFLDIGCGTAWLTRCLRGSVVALDQSESMLQRARERVPDAVLVLADVPPLPFPADSFDCAVASHVYSHIEQAAERRFFVDEALRVASSLILVEQAPQASLPVQSCEQRRLSDGSEHLVFKRYLPAAALAAEIGGEVLLETKTFVVAAASRQADARPRP
jgi:SAM-dependent methyltransferase